MANADGSPGAGATRDGCAPFTDEVLERCAGRAPVYDRENGNVHLYWVGRPPEGRRPLARVPLMEGAFVLDARIARVVPTGLGGM